MAIKFKHEKMPKGYEKRSFGIGVLKEGVLNIHALSAPMTDILYHFFKENLLSHIYELKIYHIIVILGHRMILYITKK